MALLSEPHPSPHRVVSLLPAATEILGFIGGAHLLVGRGHEDDYPPSVQSQPIVNRARVPFTTSAEVDKLVTESMTSGKGLYALDEDLIRSLNPTVILTQALCTVCAINASMVHRLASQMDPRPLVVSLSPDRLGDIIADVSKVGAAVGMPSEGAEASASLQRRVDAALGIVARVTRGRTVCVASTDSVSATDSAPRVAFMEWTDPIYCGGHWTPQMIEMAGGAHPLNPCTTDGGGAGDSFRVTPEQVSGIDPDWVVVCPCGLDIEAAKRELAEVTQREWWQNLRAVKMGQVAIVDGNQMFNRSGPRLVDALEWLVGLLHNIPEMMPPGFPWELWTPTPAPSAPYHIRGGFETAPLKNGGDWTPPHSSPDIEEAHEGAQRKGAAVYLDPATGFSVFTQQALSERGACCGNRCRHCPYAHFAVKPCKGRRENMIEEPTWLTTIGAQKEARDNNEGFSLVYFDGGVEALQVCEQLVRTTSTKPEPQTPPPQATIALFTFFNPHNGRVHHSKFSPHSSQTKKQKEAISDTPLLHSLFDQCLDRNLPLLAIPIDFAHPNSGRDDGSSTSKSAESELLQSAMQKALKTVPGKVAKIVVTDIQDPFPNDESTWCGLPIVRHRVGKS